MAARTRVRAWLVTPDRATDRPRLAFGGLLRSSMCPCGPRMSTHSGISPRSVFETGGVTMETRITETGGRRLTVRAFAKLNLGLAVTGLRPDGYHELSSLFVRINLADELSGRVDPMLTSDRLRIDGADELDPGQDIVLAAVRRLRSELGTLPPLDLELRKQIPVGAGLGGGSSDAAAALALAGRPGARASRRIAASGWQPTWVPTSRSLRAARRLPMSVGSASVWSRCRPSMAVPASCSSRRTCVFRPGTYSPSSTDCHGRGRGQARPPSTSLPMRCASESTAPNWRPWRRRLRDANDLWPAAASLAPSLSVVRDRLEGALERTFLLSGSGSTLFALYPSIVKAGDAVARLQTDEPTIVAGARLVAAVPLDS